MPKSKKPKDKNAPKRPQSAYFLYLSERRTQLKTSDPDKKVTEVSKLIGQEWKKLTDEAKKPYAAKAIEEKTKYDNKLEEYQKSSQYREYQEQLKTMDGSDDEDNEPTTKKRTKRLKDTNAPKKPQSAYFFFLGERRPQVKKEHPDQKITEIAKTLGAEWRELSASEKKKWEEKAAVAKAEYEKKLEAYKKTDNFKKFEKKAKEQKQLAKKKKKKEKEESSEEESSPPPKTKKTKKKESESGSGTDDNSGSDSNE